MTPQLLRPDHPPAELTQPCDEGPSLDNVDTIMSTFAAIVREREKAAYLCRSRHGKLVEWTKVVSKPMP